MKYNQFEFRAKAWLYPAMPGWYFISVPKELSKEIEHGFADRKRGWGSLPVFVFLGSSCWRTSIFPDKKTGTFLLPLKAAIRKKEQIKVDDTLSLLVEVQI